MVFVGSRYVRGFFVFHWLFFVQASIGSKGK